MRANFENVIYFRFTWRLLRECCRLHKAPLEYDDDVGRLIGRLLLGLELALP